MLPPITVFDVETTGLDPRTGHRIVEIAGVRIEGGVILRDSAFVSFVNPEREIPIEAQRVNKISRDDVISSPTIDVVLPQFLDFSKGSTLLAHNAPFDMGFLDHEKQFCWGYIELPECLCTGQLFKSVFPREYRWNLDVVSAKFGLVRPTNRHRALADVLLTAEALLKMLEIGNIRSMEELRRRAGVPQLSVK